MTDNAQPLSIHARIQQLWDHRADTAEYTSGLLDLAQELSQQNPDLALTMLREACAVAERIRDGHLVARARIKLAWQSYLRSGLDQALLQAAYARTVAETIGAEDLRSSALHVVALVRQRIGDYVEAEQLWRDLLARAQKAGDRGREADSLESLASLYLSQQRFVDCLKLRLQAHALYTSLNDALLPTSANNLALVHLALGKVADARAWASQALAQCPPENTYSLAVFRHTYALTLCSGDDADYMNGVNTYRYALQTVAQGPRDPNLEATFRIDLGLAFEALGNTADAISEIEPALSIAQKVRSAEQILRAHKALHAIYIKIGALEEALKHCDGQVNQMAGEKAEHGRLLAAVLAAGKQVLSSQAAWRNAPFQSAPAG